MNSARSGRVSSLSGRPVWVSSRAGTGRVEVPADSRTASGSEAHAGGSGHRPKNTRAARQ